MGHRDRQRDTAGGNRKTQGIAYVLAMGWLGVWRRRGAGRRSGGDRKRTAGLSGGWFLWGGRGEIAGVKSLKRAFRFFPKFTEGQDVNFSQTYKQTR